MPKQRVIRKKGDLTGAGKGDWSRIPNGDKKYKEGYDRIFGKFDPMVRNKVISDDS
tara:strand:- start:496 stop:663 length:168 start_codon:yes stop_codon:yes gene_type:complete